MCRWEGNVKIDINNMGSGAVDWIFLCLDRCQQEALVNKVMIIRVTSNVFFFFFFTGLVTISFRSRTDLFGVV
jgi:hypothetical protein